MNEKITDKEAVSVEKDMLPIMRGAANMAHGADPYFEVPIFTRLTRFLWMGCSPAEFPDELEEHDYHPIKRFKVPVECHWLYFDGRPRFDSIRRPFRVVVGDAKGADKLFWRAAERLSVPRLRYDAKWKLYGKGAGNKRNTVMLNVLRRLRVKGEQHCLVLAAWDGVSTGTLDMMDQARVAKFQVWVLPTQTVRDKVGGR